jgi:hypothetical protein
MFLFFTSSGFHLKLRFVTEDAGFQVLMPATEDQSILWRRRVVWQIKYYTLKMETAESSETSTPIYQISCHHIPQESNIRKS